MHCNSNVSFLPPCYSRLSMLYSELALKTIMETSRASHLFLQHGKLPVNLHALTSVYHHFEGNPRCTTVM